MFLYPSLLPLFPAADLPMGAGPVYAAGLSATATFPSNGTAHLNRQHCSCVLTCSGEHYLPEHAGSDMSFPESASLGHHGPYSRLPDPSCSLLRGSILCGLQFHIHELHFNSSLVLPPCEASAAWDTLQSLLLPPGYILTTCTSSKQQEKYSPFLQRL